MLGIGLGLLADALTDRAGSTTSDVSIDLSRSDPLRPGRAGDDPPSPGSHSSHVGRAQPLARAVSPVGPPGAPWHFLYFLPEPQGHSALRLTPA